MLSNEKNPRLKKSGERKVLVCGEKNNFDINVSLVEITSMKMILLFIYIK
jgi:hypothetical protein